MATDENSKHNDAPRSSCAAILENPISGLNTILILGSIYLAYTGYKFQLRTNVRESLEQLDAWHFKDEKLQPILYDFTYRPFTKKEVIVQLKSYRTSNIAKVSKPLRVLHFPLRRRGPGDIHTGDTLTREDYLEVITQKIDKIDGVKRVTVRENDILLTLTTTNAVDVRRITEQSLDLIHTHFRRSSRAIEAETRYLVDDYYEG